MYVLPVDFFADEEPALVLDDVDLLPPEYRLLVGVVPSFTYSHVPLLFKITFLPSVVVAYWSCAYNNIANIDAIIVNTNVFIMWQLGSNIS